MGNYLLHITLFNMWDVIRGIIKYQGTMWNSEELPEKHPNYPNKAGRTSTDDQGVYSLANMHLSYLGGRQISR